MSKTIGSFILSIWLLIIGAVVIVNYINFNYDFMLGGTNDGYFGFQSILKMFGWIKFRLQEMNFNVQDNFRELQEGIRVVEFGENPFEGVALIFGGALSGALSTLFSIIWYILNVPAVLIECLIGAFTGAFNTEYDFSKFDDLVPLMISVSNQFNVG